MSECGSHHQDAVVRALELMAKASPGARRLLFVEGGNIDRDDGLGHILSILACDTFTHMHNKDCPLDVQIEAVLLMAEAVAKLPKGAEA